MTEQNYWMDMSRRRLSRRRALRVAAIGAATLGATAVVGCDDENDGGQPTTTVGGAQEEIQRGGTFNTPRSISFLTADPAKSSTPPFTRSTIWNGVGTMNLSTGALVPILATSWEQPDAQTLIFKARQDVHWHNKAPVNGRKFTSADVKWTYQYYATDDPKFVSRGPFAQIDFNASQTPDDATVVLKQKQANVGLLRGSFGTIRLEMVAREVVERDGGLEKEVVGTGPFMMERFDPQGNYSLVRNPNYWKKDQPYLDAVRTIDVTDFTSQLASYRTGALPTMPLTYDQLKEAGDGTLIRGNGPNAWGSLRFNIADFAPFKDKRVRQAINMVVDRDELNALIYGGQAKPMGPLMSKIYGPFALPEAELRKLPGYRKPKDQDLREAKQLLDAAGYTNNLSFSILADTATNGVYSYLPAEWLVPALAKLGVKVTIDKVDFATTSRRLVARPAQFQMLSAGVGSTGDPDDAVRTSYHSKDGGRNYGGYSNPEVDRLIDAAAAEVNQERRVKLYGDLERLLLDEVPVVPTNEHVDWTAYGKSVKGFFPQDQRVVRNAGEIEQIWFDK